MKKDRILVAATFKFKKSKKLYSTSSKTPRMPECNYSPNHYEGPNYQEIQKIKNENLITSYHQYYRNPLLLHQGKMQWLFDHQGKRYLDMFGGIATVSVGHCHPKVMKAAEKQINNLWHSANVYQHPKLHEYAKALSATLPDPLKVVYFMNSGSEANDLAILMARLHTKNYDVISFRNCYHGMNSFMMGVTSIPVWRYNVPLSSNFHHVGSGQKIVGEFEPQTPSLIYATVITVYAKAVNPDVYQGIWGGKHCRDSLIQTNRECNCSADRCEASDNYYTLFNDIFKYSLSQGHVAGLLVEPIQGVGGTVQFPKGFLKKAFDLVHKNGGLFIADEVQTGFGRTGDHFWGFEMHGVQPDIVTMAKGIANGFPMSAVVTTPEIAKSLSTSSFFNTFGGNPLGCSIAMSVLQVIQEENMQLNSKQIGAYLITELAKLRDEFECVGDVRGKGLMIGVELVNDKKSREPIQKDDFLDIWEDCRNMGLLIGRGGLKGNVFRVKPPMCVSQEDAEFTVDVLRRALCNYYDGKSNKSK